ncbi:DUF317 domain-containing protein [Streptomyces bathyalis]|uniref:DUF317 domain-containing protein n=1 Tax=Streptomyces bathyalis TaxID=2710756 RepID=UPI0018D036E8|nr:DUF317 domain-containing protein [Streptomyces bathyalis]
MEALDPRRSIQFATSPRHLAGGGDPRHITQALRAAGWKNLSDPDYPHVVHAFLDDRTPRHLLAGFTTALAATAPVQRPMASVPHPHLVTQERSGPQGEALAEAHEQRLIAARAAARKARRGAAVQTQRTPAPTAAPAIARRR